MYLIVEVSEGGTYVFFESDGRHLSCSEQETREKLNHRTVESLDKDCQLNDGDFFAVHIPNSMEVKSIVSNVLCGV